MFCVQWTHRPLSHLSIVQILMHYVRPTYGHLDCYIRLNVLRQWLHINSTCLVHYVFQTSGFKPLHTRSATSPCKHEKRPLSLLRVLASLSYGFLKRHSTVYYLQPLSETFHYSKSFLLLWAKKPSRNPSNLFIMASTRNALPAHTVQATRRQAPTVYIEYGFDLEHLASIGIDVREQMEECGIRGYFNLKNQAIFPELIRIF